MRTERAPPRPPSPSRFRAALLRWFDDGHRPWPWRADRDPYRVWVSEVLLQQTRVAQAAPYFERFVRTFPDLPSLAQAPLGRVLKVWEGAGYYARARHLHAAARELVRRYDGRLPTAPEELQRLPGVGPYLSRAVASLAFGRPVLALEANGLRVAARVTLTRGDPQRAAVRSELEGWLTRALDPRRPGAFNEALMELGQSICHPRRPRCRDCPVRASCRARRELPDPAAIPERRARRPRPHLRAAIVAAEWQGRWLVHRRPPRGLLGGLWEFPGGKIERAERPEEAARREWREETGLRLPPLVPVGTLRHAYSHFSVTLHLFRGRLASAPGRPLPGPEWRWVRPGQFARLPRPRATVRAAAQLTAGGRGPRGSARRRDRKRP